MLASSYFTQTRFIQDTGIPRLRIKMAAPVRSRLATNGALIGYVTKVTLICVAVSVMATAAAITLLVGWDLDRSLPAVDFHFVAFVLSSAVPGVVVPIMTYRRAMLIRELARARDDLHRLAHTDQLTGLLNRRGFDEAAHGLIARSKAHRSPVVAMMGDFDNFKSINDELGHDFGDAALVHMADVMRRHTQHVDAVLARQGGDEFALLVGISDVESAVAVAQAMRADLAVTPAAYGGKTRLLTCSIGLASAEPASIELSTLMREADAALMEAKRNGRDRIVLVNL